MDGGSILSDLLRIRDELGIEPKRPDPFSIHGMPVIVHESKPRPKLKISDSLEWISPKKRAEMNAWLVERFGVYDDMAWWPKDSVFMFNGMLVMKPEHAALLKNVT